MLNFIIKGTYISEKTIRGYKQVVSSFSFFKESISIYFDQEAFDLLQVDEDLDRFIFHDEKYLDESYIYLNFKKNIFIFKDSLFEKTLSIHQLLLASSSKSFSEGKLFSLRQYLSSKYLVSHSKMIKTLVISTRENDSWLSMQEIIPCIEFMWGTTSGPYCKVEFLEIKSINKAVILKSILSDNIILTSFSVPCIRFVRYLRKTLMLDFRFIFHLHGFSTFACWPLYKWGMGEAIMQNDIFVSSCLRDKGLFKKIFPKAQCKVIPFTLPKKQADTLESITLNTEGPIRFVFIGRISEQKNIHSLIYAYSLFLKQSNKENFYLDIYGEEDHLGSPHIGKTSGPYLQEIEDLVAKLKLRNVKLHGFKERTWLERMLKTTKVIICSTSIHSDENFGMSAFRALCFGHTAVLSDWGGHTDLKLNFPEQVSLIPVTKGELGPYLEVENIISALKKSLRSFMHKQEARLPAHYVGATLAKEASLLLFSLKKDGHVERPNLVDKIISTHNHFKEKKSTSCQIFYSYRDLDFHLFLEAYGMSLPFRDSSNDYKITLYPWVPINGREVSLADPHRGEAGLSYRLNESQYFSVYDYKGDCLGQLSRPEGEFLILNGYAHL